MANPMAMLTVLKPGDDAERLVAHLHQELDGKASVGPVPVGDAREVAVQFHDSSEPDAEQRVRVLLDQENEGWAEFLEFMATSTTQ
jgi:hypothetical protein